jgi:pectinesterase
MKFPAFIVILLCGSAALAEIKTLSVAADGSGEFATLQAAIDAVPDNCPERTVIHLKPGTYPGQSIVGRSRQKITLEGDDAEKTLLTYGLNMQETGPEERMARYRGTGVVVLGDDFRAEKITFQNTSGDHGQAQALRIDADRAVFSNCRFLGWQDTLWLSSGRQYFRDCYIEGRVDFIYGAATAVFDRCGIHSKNGGHITAASTPQNHAFGFVFLHCRLTGDPKPWLNQTDQAATNGAGTATKPPPKADLGRPWRPYGSVAYLDCEMGDHIKPEGWNNWRNAENEKTARYSEYNSTGPGANPEARVSWSRQLTKQQAEEITLERVLAGDDGWNPLLSLR